MASSSGAVLACLDERAAWLCCPRDVREAAGAAVAQRLGPDFKPDASASAVEAHDEPAASRYLRFHHPVQSAPLVLVPGGQFLMGLRAADREQLQRYVDTPTATRLVTELRARAEPCRDVTVAPFLCATALLTRAEIISLTQGKVRRDALYPDEIGELFANLPGFRLPSEAELEYLARDGGAAAFTCDAAATWDATETWAEAGEFGVEGLSLGEWAADAWHPNYVGAPLDSKPWGNAPGVIRGALPNGPDQSNEELVFGLAAFRQAAADCEERGCFNLRLCRDL